MRSMLGATLRLLLPAFVAAAAQPLLAQDAPVGARVRVLTADVVVVKGLGRIDEREIRLDGKVSRAPDTLTLTKSSGDTLTLPRAGRRLTGAVVASDADTLTVQLDDRSVRVSIPRDAVARLEVSRGRRSRSTLRGAAIGLGVGAAGGALLGLSSGDDRCPVNSPDRSVLWGGCLLTFSAGDKAKMGAAAFGALGSLVGAAVGSQRSERWETVRPRKLSLAVRPQGQLGLALALAF